VGFLFYKNQFIDNVTEYQFLGSVLNRNGNLNSSINDLAKKSKVPCFLQGRYIGELTYIQTLIWWRRSGLQDANTLLLILFNFIILNKLCIFCCIYLFNICGALWCNKPK